MNWEQAGTGVCDSSKTKKNNQIQLTEPSCFPKSNANLTVYYVKCDYYVYPFPRRLY